MIEPRPILLIEEGSIAALPQTYTQATLAAHIVELADVQAGEEVLEPKAGTGVPCKAITAVAPSAKVFAF